jgi:CRISPR-associated protein Csm4
LEVLKLKLYEFTFKGLSYFTSEIKSYTIFGALCWGYRNLFGEKKLLDLLESFNSNPPLLISSCIFKKGNIRYFPCPQIEDAFPEPKDIVEYKKQKEIKKKLNYIHEDIFIEFLEGKIRTKWKLGQKIEECKDFETISINRTIKLHNSINRLTWTTIGGQLFNVSSWFYPEFSFFICIFDENLIDEIKAIFKYISFGGNKSIGYGKVKLIKVERVEKFEKYLNQSTQKFYTLSSTFPDSSFDYDNSYYQIEIFSGKVENFYDRLVASILKRKVLYLQPGSILAIKNGSSKKFYGNLINVLSSRSLVDPTKEVNIYQYGYAFPFYIKE